MKTKIFITCLFFVISLFVKAEEYKIKVTIHGLKNEDIYLGYHFGDKNYVLDTVKLDSKGSGVFKGTKKMDRGIYIVITPDKKYFEVIIDRDFEFELETDTCSNPSDFIQKLKIKGSDENQTFLDYQLFMTKQNRNASKIRQQIKDLEKQPDSVAVYKEELKKIDGYVKEYWNNILTKNPNTLLASLIKAITEVEVPDAPVDSLGRITDSTFQFRFFKEHYFDNINFNDAGLLRTPVYQSKLNFFITKVVPPHPDSIVIETDKIIEKSMVNREMFQFTLQYLFNHYIASNIMGHDAVYVHLGEKYYLSGKADWADSTFKAKLHERIVKTKPNVLGNKAPELKLPTYDDLYASLYQINAPFTILYFFDPDCGHCKKETPKMHELSQKYWEKGVRVFAVFTQIEKEKWVEYINEKGLTDWINCWDPYNQSNFRNVYDIYSTPIVYLLDKDKKIIAKRIDVETLEKILEDEFARKKQK